MSGHDNNGDPWDRLLAKGPVDPLAQLADDPTDRLMEHLNPVREDDQHQSKAYGLLQTVAEVGLSILFPSKAPDRMLPDQDGGSEKDIDGA